MPAVKQVCESQEQDVITSAAGTMSWRQQTNTLCTTRTLAGLLRVDGVRIREVDREYGCDGVRVIIGNSREALGAGVDHGRVIHEGDVEGLWLSPRHGK